MNIISRKDAREQRLKFYFTGIPCKNSHISTRYVISNHCIECNKTNSVQYYSENKDAIINRNVDWRKYNPTYNTNWLLRSIEHRRLYRKNNPQLYKGYDPISG
jgi:hypothetical protein